MNVASFFNRLHTVNRLHTSAAWRGYTVICAIMDTSAVGFALVTGRWHSWFEISLLCLLVVTLAACWRDVYSWLPHRRAR